VVIAETSFLVAGIDTRGAIGTGQLGKQSATSVITQAIFIGA
jgi:hypothetical protein